MWRRFDAEGAEWEVRAIPTSADVADAAGGAAQEVLGDEDRVRRRSRIHRERAPDSRV